MTSAAANSHRQAHFLLSSPAAATSYCRSCCTLLQLSLSPATAAATQLRPSSSGGQCLVDRPPPTVADCSFSSFHGRLTPPSVVVFNPLIGHNLSDDEIVVHTLNGLGVEYKELAATIRARDSSLSFEEMYDKLTDYETYLKRKDRAPGPPITTQVSHK
ncbi:hypothetical protein BHE74_00028187 [Ensete ventricosum]|nr:hypothetical protein BHE74_00028187 [Ensete ventricosum]